MQGLGDGPLISVSQLAWRRVPQHERIWWTWIACIIPVMGTYPRLIESATPDIAKVVEKAKAGISKSDDEE